MKRVHLGIVERHADEAAFLWARRDRAVRSPLFDLESLAEIDGRLDANLEGLAAAGEHGLAAAQGALDRAALRTSDLDGEIFAAVCTAAALGDVMALARLLARAEKRPNGARPVVSALAWLPAATAARILGEMSVEGGPAWLQRLALGAHAARREDPGQLLLRALHAADPSLRDRAFRAAGELGRRDLLPALRAELEAGAAAAPHAAWSAALLGEPQATELLWSLAGAGGPFAEAAAAMAARTSTAEAAAGRLLALARSPAGLPSALAGAAARGDPACVPWVLAVLAERPGAAHRAAWVYATITGAELAPPLAVRTPTLADGVRDIASLRADVHRDLPSPDPEAIAAHWARSGAGFPAGERFLGGRRIDADWLERCLGAGAQPWRHAAAVELALRGARPSVFPVRAAAHVQAALLPLTAAGSDR